MDPVELVRLPGLMALTRGKANVVIGLMDGPVALDHPDLATGNVRTLMRQGAACTDASDGASCRHGTFVAGILAAERGARAPGIAPDCTLLVRPIFSDAQSVMDLPSATPRELAAGIADCVDAGAWVLNLSAAVAGTSIAAERELEEALRYMARRGVLMVAAAGNQGTVAGSVITRHPFVISVVAYTREGRPLPRSNLGRSIGIGGLGGPGDAVVSLAPHGEPTVSAGTSIAAPFVTAAVALLWSLFPAATPAEVRSALRSPNRGRRTTVTPPLLDAWGAYEALSADQEGSAMQ